MFEKITNLVESLSLENVGSYTQCKKVRKVLQEIKKEAQELRGKIINEFKSFKKESREKKVKQLKPFSKEAQLRKKEIKSIGMPDED